MIKRNNMIITPHEAEKSLKKFMEDPMGYVEEIRQQILSTSDTQICIAREPVIGEFPKGEGIMFIFDKILELENHSTEEIANSLIDYIPFMKKHKIKIIKEYDEECKLASKGKIPNIKVKSLETQAFYGFNKFHIIDADTLSRKDEKGKIYISPIDFSYALDSNAASFFEKHCINSNDKYKELYDVITSDKNNIDIVPYIFETIMNGLKNYGINYKLNKKNKNEDQAAFFQNLSVLCEQGLFKEKRTKLFLNKTIKNGNNLIEFYGTIGYQARLFLILLLEAKFKFGKSSNKIKEYVYTEMRNLNLPIENRLKVILYLFAEKPGHPFFGKVINMNNFKSLEDYLDRVDNTARDIALVHLEKYFYGRLDIYPFLATDDEAFVKMLQDTRADYIVKYDDLEVPVYINIIKDMKKKHLKFFETETPKSCYFEDTDLKDLMSKYKSKIENFKQLISR